jgi:hypothetical protein
MDPVNFADIFLTSGKTAPMVASNDLMNLHLYLLLFIIAIVPIISIVLSILLWKKNNYARRLTTLFIILVSFFAMLFILGRGLPLVFLLGPIVLGVGVLYLLWMDNDTAKQFGSYLSIRESFLIADKDFSRMPGRVKILFLLFVIPALLMLFFALIMGILLSSRGSIEANISLFFIVVIFVTISWSISYLIIKGNILGRYLGFIYSILILLAIPIGTILGALSLYFLIHSEVREYFEAK